MKANETPDKIYIPTILAANTVRYKKKGSIEYTRTDVFIEKAIGWLKEQDEMIGVSFQEDFIERFQNYMKGE